ncbi:MAG: hypothetical protein U0930_23810 [Pirellulales bacterium]
MAVKEAKDNGCDDVREQFEQWVVKQTRPVICRNWGTVAPILSKPGDLFRTFYEMIDAGDRQPQDNEFDQARQAVDATFFPHFYQRVNFAALTGDGKGPASYGEIHFTFQESAVSHRTTVFEENTLVFCKKHKVVVGAPPPEGFLSTWANRGQLAVAKLSKNLRQTMTEADFPGILVIQSGKTDTDEFIECHIYGRLTVSNIESFRAKMPKLKADQVLARQVRRKLLELEVREEPF